MACLRQRHRRQPYSAPTLTESELFKALLSRKENFHALAKASAALSRRCLQRVLRVQGRREGS